MDNRKNCTIINCTFTSNKVGTYGAGGAIYCQGSNTNIINSTFIKNNSPNEGGTIFCDGNYGNIINCTFSENTVTRRGAAIFLKYGSKWNIIDSKFIKNEAREFGGAIYALECNIDVYNCSFIENKAGESGGAIFGNKMNIINKSLFYRNAGKNGAALSINNGNITNSIILNNTIHSGGKVIDIGNVNLNNNWFGNTVYDYNINPDINSTLENWLFINATYERLMLIGEQMPIEFVFQVFDGTTVLDYDSSKICPIKLTLSATNGEIDKTSIDVGEDVSFNASAVGIGNITATFFDRQLTINFACKYPTEIIACEPISIYVDQVMNFVGDEFNVKLVKPENGDLYYSTDNETILSITNTGFKGINAGNANIIVETQETEEYAPAHILIPITVKKYATEIIFDDTITMNYGESKTIVPKLTPNVGNLVFCSENSNIAIINNQGLITTLNAGNVNIIVKFEGNRKYEASYKIIKLIVNKIDSTLELKDIEYTYGNSGSTSVKYNGASSVNAFIVNYPNANVNVLYGSISVSGLNAGDYILSVTTVPDNNHNAITVTKKVKVNKADSSINIPDIVFAYGSSGSAKVNLMGANGITNVFVVNHPEAIINVNRNMITVSGLAIGSYTLTATSVPDNNHNSISNTANIIVKKADSSIIFTNDIIFDFRGSASTTAIIEDANGITNVHVVDHPEAIIEISNNVITVSNLNVGRYTLTATTIPQDSYNAVSNSTNIIVTEINSTFKVTKNVVFDYGGSNFDSLIVDGIIGIKAYVVNHPEAKIQFDGDALYVSNLNVGSYKLSVTTVPDSNHREITTSIPFSVKKVDSRITVTKIIGKTSLTVLNAIVRDNKGNPINGGIVIFTINGKSYKVYVHNGIARKNLKFTKAKTYFYRATYVNSNFNSKSVSSKAVVIQSKAVISAKKSSAILGEYVALRAVVKDTNGKFLNEGLVKFIINGKTYTVRVNNGAAMMTLKLSQVKTYPYKAIFSSSYYSSKLSASEIIIKKQPIFTVKMGGYSVKISYNEYKKIINARNGAGYYLKNFDTGKTIDYRIYMTKTVTLTKYKLLAHSWYSNGNIHSVSYNSANYPPAGYTYVGAKIINKGYDIKEYQVYKKIVKKKVFVGTKKTKVYIGIDSNQRWGSSARIYYLNYVSDGEYRYYLSNPKKIF